MEASVDDPSVYEAHTELVDDRIEQLGQFAHPHSVLLDAGRVRVAEVAVDREQQVNANSK